MVKYIFFEPWEHIPVRSSAKLTHFHSSKCIEICRLRNGGYLSRPQYVKMEQRCDLNKNTTILIPDNVSDYVFCMMLANV